MTEPNVRHMKSTSMAEYFAVPDGKGSGVVTVRQSNLNGVICCLTCLTTRCPHISAALPAIEAHTTSDHQPDAHSAQEQVA
jgi:hypothetical protein